MDGDQALGLMRELLWNSMVIAAPFTLVRVPAVARVLFALALAVCLVAANPDAALLPAPDLAHLAVAAMRELLLGVIVVLAFQLVFAALYLAGRTIDIQAGYGL